MTDPAAAHWDADQVCWVTADILTWHPHRRYQAWHDRAVYHFLTTGEQR